MATEQESNFLELQQKLKLIEGEITIIRNMFNSLETTVNTNNRRITLMESTLKNALESKEG